MPARTIVITGGTSGIGEVAAVELARQGARIVLIARNPDRIQTTLPKIRQANPAAEHVAHVADLSRIAETTRVARQIASAESSIDVLVNNAGAMFGKRQVTEDGLEKTFALNHMSYFVVTEILRPVLGPGARIVSTASDAHRGARLDFSDLQSERGYSGFAAYGRSKLCNILFNRELARRLEGTGVTANCLHPGFVNTRFGEESGGVAAVAIRVAKPLGAISAQEGARTIVHLATSPDVAGMSGGYFYKCRPATPAKEAQSDEDASRLWEESARLMRMVS